MARTAPIELPSRPTFTPTYDHTQIGLLILSSEVVKLRAAATSGRARKAAKRVFAIVEAMSADYGVRMPAAEPVFDRCEF